MNPVSRPVIMDLHDGGTYPQDETRELAAGRQLTFTAAKTTRLRCPVCKRPPREVSAANLWKRYRKVRPGAPLFFPPLPERPLARPGSIPGVVMIDLPDWYYAKHAALLAQADAADR